MSYETRRLVEKELDILGEERRPEDFEPVIRVLEARQVPVDQALTAVVSLKEAPQALCSSSEIRRGLGKLWSV